MLGYLVHRILIMIPTLIAISLVIFIIIHLPPGDYFSTYIAELQSQGEQANLAKIAFLKAQYGFDRPLWQQYLYWVVGLIQGDMGYSFLYDLPVNKVVGDRLFLTFLVSFMTIVFTYLVAFPIGVYSATHQYSTSDYLLTFYRLPRPATPSCAGVAAGLFRECLFRHLGRRPDGPAPGRRAAVGPKSCRCSRII
jgi:peptide/nickel transport system permease protein